MSFAGLQKRQPILGLTHKFSRHFMEPARKCLGTFAPPPCFWELTQVGWGGVGKNFGVSQNLVPYAWCSQKTKGHPRVQAPTLCGKLPRTKGIRCLPAWVHLALPSWKAGAGVGGSEQGKEEWKVGQRGKRWHVKWHSKNCNAGCDCAGTSQFDNRC